ncbi:NADPH-dependent FMN reductase [Nocardia sp. alder85J]|uniref:NADPH-dependent FMN reductase n=1 Tax=Nocardia sp. alder85J TaxID=2862949 RepID=UPI001CD4DE09|nr:NADPH-dependent FMN reductase [Nocardia sp. alder85J]MCX4098795.1 NAD(P)H-dependent oxidoreductase [Nocardia sp. alder85J]
MGTHLLLISGSTRTGSTNTAALRTLQQVAPQGISTHLYDELTTLPAFVPGDDPSPPPVTRLRHHLAAADAVLFCTPEYAGLIPGALKNLLEWTVGTADLSAKPVAWITVAVPGRGDGATTSLRTVLGYVDADIIESACTRIPILSADVAADGTIPSPDIRTHLATAAESLTAALPAQPKLPGATH